MTNAERIAKRAKGGRVLLVLAVAAACGFGLFAVVVNFQQGADITKIESPCIKYGPDSKQCERAFSAAIATITHPQACAVERKAGTLRAIRELADELGIDFSEPCAGARIAQERERSNERAKTRRQQQSRGGDALQPGSTGHQPSGPRGGGGGSVGDGAGKGGGASAPGGKHAGENGNAEPDQGAEQAEPATGGSGGQQSSVPPAAPPSEPAPQHPDPPANPIAEGAGKALEDVGGVVQETGSAGNGVVGKATEGIGQVAEGGVCGTVEAPGCSR